MKKIALVLVLAVFGCQTPNPEVAVRYRWTAKSESRFCEVKCWNGRVISLDAHHRLVWRNYDYDVGGRLCLGFSKCEVGDEVTILTPWKTIKAKVVGNDPVFLDAEEDTKPGMSGAGVWKEDGTIVGVVMSYYNGDPRFVRCELPDPAAAADAP